MASLRACCLGVIVLASNVRLHAQSTERVSVDSTGGQLPGGGALARFAVSEHGRFVVFSSRDVFVRDRLNGTTECVSVSYQGSAADADSWDAGITPDGRFVVFVSSATNLVAGDVNGSVDVFVRDRLLGTTERVSTDSAGNETNGSSYVPAITPDGCVVAFVSYATNLVSGDTNGQVDVFVRDRQLGVTERVSVDSSGVEAVGSTSYYPAISADGRLVAFMSGATNLVPGSTVGGVFIRDRQLSTTELVSVDSAGTEGNQGGANPSISADGRFIAFESVSTNLVAGDTNNATDVFVHDRVTGSTERVSVSSSGVEGNSVASYPTISSDGLVVAFDSYSWNPALDPDDTNSKADVYVHDRTTRLVHLASVADDGTGANGECYGAAISPEGGFVAFMSGAANLVLSDTNGAFDVFLRDLPSLVLAAWSAYGSGFPGANGVPVLTAQNNPVLGTTLLVNVGSSATTWTLAYLLAGVSEASIPLRKGGDLLVIPSATIVLALPPAGSAVTYDIADDPALSGLEIFAQTLVLDPGAAKGQSASAGLKLVLGH